MDSWLGDISDAKIQLEELSKEDKLRLELLQLLEELSTIFNKLDNPNKTALSKCGSLKVFTSETASTEPKEWIIISTKC